jgi:hypothetical protein
MSRTLRPVPEDTSYNQISHVSNIALKLRPLSIASQTSRGVPKTSVVCSVRFLRVGQAKRVGLIGGRVVGDKRKLQALSMLAVNGAAFGTSHRMDVLRVRHNHKFDWASRSESIGALFSRAFPEELVRIDPAPGLDRRRGRAGSAGPGRGREGTAV